MSSEDAVPAESSEPDAVSRLVATGEARSLTTAPKVDVPARRGAEPLFRCAVRPPGLSEAEQRRPRVEPLVPIPVAVLRPTAVGRQSHRKTVVRRPALQRSHVSRASVAARDVRYDLTVRRPTGRVEVRPVRLLRRSTPSKH